MKFFALIFTFYMLGLACLPCSDIDECITKTDTTITNHSNQHGHNKVVKHCSPFCICACCATSIVFHKIVNYTTHKVTIISVKYPFYPNFYLTHSTSNIWQPPKNNTEC